MISIRNAHTTRTENGGEPKRGCRIGTFGDDQNIGYDLGENGRTAEWYRANHRTPWVAGRLVAGEFTYAVPIAV